MRQISVFLDDRVGALMRLFQAFEGTTVRVVGMSVVHAIDCAIVRLLCDDNDQAIDILKKKNFPFSETELVVVEVPHGHGLRSICSALLGGEINIDYAYPLLVRPTGRAALDAWNRRVLATGLAEPRLRSSRALLRAAERAGFPFAIEAGLRPFLLPPIPRASILIGRPPEDTPR